MGTTVGLNTWKKLKVIPATAETGMVCADESEKNGPTTTLGSTNATIEGAIRFCHYNF